MAPAIQALGGDPVVEREGDAEGAGQHLQTDLSALRPTASERRTSSSSLLVVGRAAPGGFVVPVISKCRKANGNASGSAPLSSSAPRNGELTSATIDMDAARDFKSRPHCMARLPIVSQGCVARPWSSRFSSLQDRQLSNFIPLDSVAVPRHVGAISAAFQADILPSAKLVIQVDYQGSTMGQARSAKSWQAKQRTPCVRCLCLRQKRAHRGIFSGKSRRPFN